MIVNSAVYVEGTRATDVDLESVSDQLCLPGRFVWLGLNDPDEATMKKLQKQFNLHELAIEDAHRAHQRAKIETYGDTLFIVLRTVQMKKKRVELGETHFFLGSNFLITIRHHSSTSYAGVRARCESSPHLLKKGPAFALYAVMDFIVDEYFPVIHELEMEVASIEESIFREKLRRDTTFKIYKLKRQILDVKRSVSPLIDICNRLMRFDLKVIDEDTKPYFRDVYDHAVRINENVDNARELLSTALEANLSMITITQSEVGKRFAGWAAIIGVATMVAGIYGMNFKFMPELEWRYGYFVVIGGTAAVCLYMYYKFKKAGWL
ncbi:MAG: magnesium/cobalt transporter CorA [Cyclobacteriaceae bacterium]|nr:magnesium/cobalt transporter CorA [Cyclobacteriaceae bacterium]